VITRLDRLLESGDLTPIRVRATAVVKIWEPQHRLNLWAAAPAHTRYLTFEISVPAELIVGRRDTQMMRELICHVYVENVDEIDWRLHGGR
jgi:hypothetical protein